MMRFREMRVLMVALLAAAFAATGCSRLNGTGLEPLLGGDVDFVSLGDKVAESLVSQPLPPLLAHQPDQPILVTTLVSNDNLDESSSFGRSFQNNITAGLVSRGYAVKEVKLRRDLLVAPNKGEIMLTRDLRDMANRQRAQAVVVGTYAMANRVMYLSVRLVDPTTQAIRAVHEDKLTLDDNSLRLLGLKLKRGSADEHDPIQPAQPPSPSPLDAILY